MNDYLLMSMGRFLCLVLPDLCQPVKDGAPPAPAPCPDSSQSGGVFAFDYVVTF